MTDAETASRRGTGARPLRILQAASGTVAAGLVALAAVVVVAAVVAGDRAGPGAGVLAGHVGVATAAVLLQVLAQRRRGALAAFAVLAVFALAVVALWIWWWS